MSLDQNLKKILIIDFGSQFTQLIARRVRELGVFSEIVSHKKIKLKDINNSIKGMVLSGGPLNVYQINKYSFDKKILQLGLPVLGICFGHQILSKLNGGRVKQSKHREFGLANVYKKNNSLLTTNFFGNKKSKQVWMSHADQVSKLPKNFKVVASSTNSKFAIVENKIKKYYGVQFHPEVTHTQNGKKLISNFIFLICKIKKNWSSKDQKNQLIKDVRTKVENNKVICALSGGVDSSVVAQLLNKAIGADHAGYIKRISSSVEALSGKKDKLICKISQLVKLIKDNKPFKMSKRKGDYITVDDLIKEVGKDATRFIMLNRSSDVELDFDFDAVKEKSKDNPLYYVQYCYARISSVFRHIGKDLNSNIKLDDFSFEYSNDEIKILKKISEWPKCIDAASSKLEPHRIPVYLYDLASEFHSYWNLGKQNPEKRFINDQKTVSPDKLIFLKAISNVVKSGMNIVGVDTPDKM